MKDTRAPSKMKPMGGRELTDVLGADFESMAALVLELLGWPFVPVAKLAGLSLTPGQEERLEGLIRGIILTRNTGEKIAESLACMAERDARVRGSVPLSLAMGESLRLGVGAAYAVSLCHQALRLYEEVTGKAMPEASELIAKADAKLDALAAMMAAQTATLAAQTATLDTIQTHTAGVPAMVEREQIDSAREQQKVLAQAELLELPPEGLRLVTLWYRVGGNVSEIARQMQRTRPTVYEMKKAVQRRYRERGLPDPFVRLPSRQEAERQRQRDARDRQAGGAERGMGDAWHSEQ